MVWGAFLPREMLRLHPATVNFAAYLELTGLRAVLQVDEMHLGLRCRLLRELQRPLCCFFHILDEEEERPLEGRVVLDDGSLAGARRGDDLLIAAEQAIRPALSRRFAELRLGFCDPHSDASLPVCASSLPVTRDYTAVRVRWNEPPPTRLLYSFGWPILKTCRVVLEGGVELVAYSLQRLDESVWVRLRWQIRSRPGRRLRVLARVPSSENADDDFPASFDQEMGLEARAPTPCLEQNVIVRIPDLGGARMQLRLGVLDSQEKNWLQVSDCSTGPGFAGRPYFFLPFPEGVGGG